jgi:hypothetical protein
MNDIRLESRSHTAMVGSNRQVLEFQQAQTASMLLHASGSCMADLEQLNRALDRQESQLGGIQSQIDRLKRMLDDPNADHEGILSAIGDIMQIARETVGGAISAINEFLARCGDQIPAVEAQKLRERRNGLQDGLGNLSAIHTELRLGLMRMRAGEAWEKVREGAMGALNAFGREVGKVLDVIGTVIGFLDGVRRFFGLGQPAGI